MLITLVCSAAGLASSPDFRSQPAIYVRQSNGYSSHGSRMKVTLRADEIRICGIRLQHSGSSAVAPVSEGPGGRLRIYTRNAPRVYETTGTVVYRDLYPGVTARFSFDGNIPKTDYILEAGSDPGRIRIRYADARTTEIVDGNLIVIGSDGTHLEQPAPAIYQESAGSRVPVQGGFKLFSNGDVGFRVAGYDSSQPLIIDPYLVSSTAFVGGTAVDKIAGIAADSAGNVYVTGSTESSNLPGSYTSVGQDAFVLKLSPSNQLIWATYFSGSAYDAATAIALDAAGSAYITGFTTSNNFPLLSAVRSGIGGSRDAFVAKVNSGGAMQFCTYLGGGDSDTGNAITVGANSDVWVAGETLSQDLPTVGAYQGFNRGGLDAFLTRLTSAGALLSSTYLGGSGDDRARAVAVNGSGVFVAGGTRSSLDFPVASAYQAVNAGEEDVFVSRFNTSATSLVYSTYIGGSGLVQSAAEAANAIAIDASGSVYVAGSTVSDDFPLVQPLRAEPAGAFLLRLSPAGTPIFSSFLDGARFDTANSVALRSDGSIYVAGETTSPDLALIDSVQSWAGTSGKQDGFVTRFNSTLDTVLFQTYVGGTGAESISGIALNASDVYLAGYSSSPTVLGTSGLKGQIDGFVARLQERPVAVLVSTNSGGTQVAVSGANCGAGTYTDSANLGWAVGATCTVTAITPRVPSAGVRQRFTGWSDGSSANPRSYYVMPSQGNVLAQFSTEYAVTRNTSGGGMVTSTPSPPDGYFAAGSTVTISAAANTGFRFTGWSGDLTGTANPASLPVSGPRSVTATFACHTTVSATTLAYSAAAGTGSIAVTSGTGCPWSAISGASWLTITSASAGSGSGTVQFSLSTNVPSTARSTSITIGENIISITQNAAASPSVTLGTSPTGLSFTIAGAKCSTGSFTGPTTLASSADANCTVSTQAVQSGGTGRRYRFTRWSDGSTANPRSFTGVPAANLTMQFAVEYTLTQGVNNSAGGSLSVVPASADGFYAEGSAVQVSAAPSTGYRFSGWTGDLSGTSNPASLAVTAARTVTATFACTYGLSAAAASFANSGGTVAISVSTGSGCTWGVSGSTDWISVISAGGVATIATAPNPASTPRSAVINVAGSPVTVTQAGVPDSLVSFSTSPSGIRFVVAGANCNAGTYTSPVTLAWRAGATCTVSVSSPQSVGGKAYAFTAWQDGSTAPSRTFNAAGNMSYTINFAPACTFSFSPSTLSMPSAGGRGTFRVSTSPAGCEWANSSNASWAQLYPLSGSGEATIEYTIYPNMSTATRSAAFQFGAQTLSVSQAAGSGTYNQRFAALMYFTFFGRTATASEIQLQASVLDRGTAPGKLAQDFFSTDEFNLGGRFVAGLYVGLLNRDAEYGGWLFQRTAMTSGIVNPNQLVTNFIGGAEYKLNFGTPTDAEYVQLLYRYILLREAAPAEVAFQVSSMKTIPITRVQLASAFLNSAEFRQGTGPRLTAFLLYACILSRDATETERSALAQRVASGVPVRTLIDELVASSEFAALLR